MLNCSWPPESHQAHSGADGLTLRNLRSSLFESRNRIGMHVFLTTLEARIAPYTLNQSSVKSIRSEIYKLEVELPQ